MTLHSEPVALGTVPHLVHVVRGIDAAEYGDGGDDHREDDEHNVSCAELDAEAE